MEAHYFASPEAFRTWLEEHHDSASEVLVGYHKRNSGKPSMTWPESVDEALCYGWIDGVRRRVDDERYTIRFTPRKPKSNWSAVNLRRVEALAREGRMKAAGLAIFEKRERDRGKHYSYENRPEDFPERERSQFSENATAWAFFQRQPPTYRRALIWWVISAKRPETRQKRLAELMDYSETEMRHPLFNR